MIDDADIARVREAADLVAIAGEHVQIHRAGRQWKAQCPFHDERTPSLSINAEEGLWWCFGCNQGGDTIEFVRRIHHLDFVEAVEWLAGRFGVELSRRPSRASSDTRGRLTAITSAASAWYHEQLLTSSEAADARRYLADRGIAGELLELYELGWAPAGWDNLTTTLSLTRDVAIAAGVAKTNRAGRLQDVFRSRIVFPIRDLAGDVIGFGARALPGADGPKYLNSPDGRLYQKRRALYGLHNAKSSIVTAGAAVICEGYFDVIGAHAAGIPNAVASCGTALGHDHLQLLGRFTDRLVLAFDADAAGANAVARLHDLADRHNVTFHVAALPADTDPGDLGFSNPAGLTEAIEHAAPLMAFLVDRAIAAGDRTTIEGRVRTATDALTLVAEHPDRLVRDEYLMVVATQLQLDSALLRNRLNELAAARSSDAPLPHQDELPPIPAVELAALQLGTSDTTSGDRWWLDPILFADQRSQSAAAALGRSPSVAAALDELEPAGRSALLMAATESASSADVDEVAARLVQSAIDRRIQQIDPTTPEAIQLLTTLRRQLQLLRPAATRHEAARAAYSLLCAD